MVKDYFDNLPTIPAQGALGPIRPPHTLKGAANILLSADRTPDDKKWMKVWPVVGGERKPSIPCNATETEYLEALSDYVDAGRANKNFGTGLNLEIMAGMSPAK